MEALVTSVIVLVFVGMGGALLLGPHFLQVLIAAVALIVVVGVGFSAGKRTGLCVLSLCLLVAGLGVLNPPWLTVKLGTEHVPTVVATDPTVPEALVPQAFSAPAPQAETRPTTPEAPPVVTLYDSINSWQGRNPFGWFLILGMIATLGKLVRA